jgi:hypothetical protein
MFLIKCCLRSADFQKQASNVKISVNILVSKFCANGMKMQDIQGKKLFTPLREIWLSLHPFLTNSQLLNTIA